MQTSWSLRENNSREGLSVRAASLSRDLKLSTLLIEYLFSRGFQTSEEIQRFLFPKAEDILDPFLFPRMDEAVQLIKKHTSLGNRILIHGDYDVDGVTSSAILKRTLSRLNADTLVFIPHRIHHGYGFSEAGVGYAVEQKVRLIITADCGITAFDAVEKSRQAGIDVIICDHHQISSRGIPPANVVVHPLATPEGAVFKQLSAAGVVFKLAQAILGDEALEFLDLAALGTVADASSLHGDNRVFVKLGLEKFKVTGNLGLRALAKAAKLRGRTSPTHFSFGIAPLINAAGRMDSAEIAFQILVSSSEREVESLVRMVQEVNKRRQQLEKQAVRQAIRQVETEIHFNRDRVIVLWNRDWHPGIIGIVASRLVDRFHRPAIVIALDDKNEGKGSARSIRHFNIYEAIRSASEYLLEWGGHEFAAGLSIKEEKLEIFRRTLNEKVSESTEASVFIRSYEVDLEIELSKLSGQLLQELSLLEPFGMGNPKPLFLSRNVRIKTKPQLSGKESLSFWVESGEITLEAVFRNRDSFVFSEGDTVDLIYTPSFKEWTGVLCPVLEVKDIRKTESH